MKFANRILAILFLPVLALAQIDSGSIVGTVTDQSGAVIPGATITVTNKKTGVVVTTTTNNAGQYQVLALIPGQYSARATARGLASQDYPDVEIHVQSRPALDFRLAMATSQETVVVTAAEPVLQTQSAELGAVVNEKVINDLPLNGRVYAQLALLEAGAGKFYGGPNETPDRFSVNGNSEMQNYFALDGVDNNSGSTNQQDNSMQVVQPPPDALQEFKVQTRTYSAEFGNAAGGVVNVSTKSGTNQFHGSLWEFLRNDKLDANAFFDNKNGTPRGQYKLNQWGGTVGGPIIRNKTFFFADFQGYNSRRATTQLSTVPTPLMKKGDFRELSYNLQPVAPGQAGCIVNNVVQASCVDPAGAKLLSLYPDPNVPGAVAKQGTPGSFDTSSNYQYSVSAPNDTYSTDVRIDHNLNQSNRLTGRYSFSRVRTQDPAWTSNPLAGASNFASDSKNTGHSAMISWTDSLSPALLNEVRLGFNRMMALKNAPGSLEMGKSAATEYGIPGMPDTPFNYGLPPINVNQVRSLGSSPWRPQEQLSQVYQLMDDLSWLKNDHSLKFGYHYYRSNLSFLDIYAPQGSMSASGIYTNANGFGVADLLLGDMSAASYTTPTFPHNYRPGHSFYAQDTWRLSKRLTLNLGVRYELFSPMLDHSNEIANFSPANGGTILTVAKGASSWYERSLIHPDRNNFAPRAGFAWQAHDRLVVRGGYGVFFQHNYRFGSEAQMSLNTPFLADYSLSQQQGSTTPVFRLSSGFPIEALIAAHSVYLPGLQIRAQDPDQRTSYVEQTSFGVQYELTPSMTLTTDYVGNFGHKMARIRNANQGRITGVDGSGEPIVVFPYDNLNDGGSHSFLEYATHDGNLTYNGLQTSLRRRFSRSLAFGLSYAWSHSLSDYNTPINGNYTAQNAYDMSAERSDSTLDVRHRFSGSALWSLPIGKGGAVLNNLGRASSLLGGWQLNGIVTMQTGNPFSVTASDNSRTGGNHSSYASCVSDPFAGASSNPRDYVSGGSGFYINPAAFAVPGTGQFGNCSPYPVHGPGMQNFDLSLFKGFQITESKRVEFRSEFFNAFNHANFGAPSSNINDPGSFGKVQSTVGSPREIQFALKLYF